MHWRHARTICRCDERFVHEALLVGRVQQLRPLAGNFHRRTACRKLGHPRLHLLGFARFALDAKQRCLQRILRSPFIAAFSALIEIHRRLLQREQRGRHLFRGCACAEVFL